MALFAIFLMTKGAPVANPNSIAKINVPIGVGELVVTYGMESKYDARLVGLPLPDTCEVVLEFVTLA